MSDQYTQQDRRLSINTPLGQDVLLLTSFSGREELSRLYSYRLEMLSAEDKIDPKDIVGKFVSVSMLMLDDTPRFFNGIVNRFICRGKGDRLSAYAAEISPSLWFLTRSSNCRIFQNKTIVQIVTDVLSDAGITDFDITGIKGKHQPWEYCVQYRETDFNFISRLLEHEGIFYSFKHEDGKTTLMLADDQSAYVAAQEGDVCYNAAPTGAPMELHAWEKRYEYQPGQWTHTDFNFETPASSLLSKTPTTLTLAGASKIELFDYPGEYEKRTDGDADGKLRMEAIEAQFQLARGSGPCMTFSPGLTFNFTEHLDESEVGNAYLLTAVEHRISTDGAYITGAGEGQERYANHFECIPATIAFRPQRLTPKPMIHGVQTAIVVGPDGQEIYTDQYGRVKVHFHWDRYGTADEKASCWIRVGQIWAGKSWGAMFIPRIGQEVIVEFLEGDPDRPIITGRVYNADSTVPYPLPDNATVSTIKSLSSKGGGGFNELRFEDKKGSEQVFVHGEKNMDVRVKNDSKEWVGHDRHLHVVNDQFEHIEVDRHEKIDRDHVENLGRDRNTTIGGKEAKQVTGSMSVKVIGDVAEVFSSNHSEQTSNQLYLKADTIVIEGMTNVTIKVGQSYIAIDATGISLGTNGTVEMQSQSTMSIQSTAPMTIKSQAQAQMQAPMISVQADAMLTLKGGIVMIN